jgi:flagellar motility protein MotE (MotC chaperone)
MALIEKLRLLPTLLIAAVLLLVVKVGDVWQQTDLMLSGVSVARAEQPKPAEKAAPAQAQPAKPDPAAAEAAKTGATAEKVPAPAETTKTAEAEKPADAPKTSDLAGDPATMSKAEIELLQSLSQRRAQLDDRARDLDMREKVLAATEGRIDEKISELKALQAKIDGMVQQHDTKEEEQLASLVKVYESMKPKDAARIFDQLDMAILLSVAERMKETKMAAVLAEMSSPAAKALTVELATRHKLPETGG